MKRYKDRKKSFARTYTWITWQENGDFFSAWPDHTGKVVMYEDDFYRKQYLGQGW